MSDRRRPDLEQLFRDEANERLDRIVEILLAAERDAPSADTVRVLFREVHSVKGGAGMFGADDAYAVANAIEDVLSDARDAGRLEPALVAPLLQAADALREIVEGRAASPDLALSRLGEARAQLAEADPPAPGAEPDAQAAEMPPAVEAPATTPDDLPTGPAESPATPASAGPPAPEPEPEARAAGVDGERRSVRVDVEKVDRLLDAVGETALHQRRLQSAVSGDGADRGALDGERNELLLDELQNAVIALRMLPIASVTGAFPRLVRDIATAQGKQVELVIVGADTQLDRVVLDGATEAIAHLLRNAVAHGIETADERRRAGKPERGRIEIRAIQRGHSVAIEVEDDGRGVAPELLRQAGRGGSLADVLAQAGLSTAASVTEASGRGVGMDAVRSHVRALGGELQVRSQSGRGTLISLLLPVSLALPHVLLVERAGIVFGIPLTAVSEAVIVEERLQLGGRSAIEVRGEQLVLVDLIGVLGGAGPEPAARPAAVVVSGAEGRVALLCDTIVGDQEVLVKPLGPVLEPVVTGYLGATVLLDGRVALILDIPAVISAAEREGAGSPEPESRSAPRTPTVLVVDDQFTVRELQRSILEAAGYLVQTARDGREAWDLLAAGAGVDLVLTDIEMPGMDGLELAGAIRRRPDGDSLPIVMVTSRGSEADRRRGLEAGADAYIVKEGFDQRALLDTVRRLVHR